MATTQLTHIVYPNGDTSNSIPFIVGTGTTAGTWLGELEGLTAYYDGLLILYKSPVAGASTTTLNLNGLGAKTVYLNHTTKLTTHYPANQPILLTYSTSQNSGCWEAIDNYDSNSNTIGEYAGACKAGTNGMARYSLIMKTKQAGNDETWESLVTTSSTATTKAKTSSGFIVGSPVLYQSAGTYAKDGVSGTTGCWSTAYNLDTRYSCNVSSTWSAAGRPFFIKGTINATDGKFYLANTTWWSDAYPTTADGFYYIYVGQMVDAYRCTLYPEHPIFYYSDGLKVLINGSVTNAQTVNGHTVEKDVPSNAVFTDTTYTIATGDSNGQIKVTPTGGTAYNVSVKGLGSNAYSSTAYLPLTGGTLSDTLTIARTSFVDGQPNPGLILKASNQDVTSDYIDAWGNSEINFHDQNEVRTGYINIKQLGATISLGLSAITEDNSQKFYNNIRLSVDRHGNQSYEVSDPTAFRSAIELGTAAVKDVPSSGNASTTQVVMGNDTRLSNARTPTSHTHGNIQNDGTLQTTDVAIANGDKLVVTDSSDSNQIARTSLSFDGSTATQCLTKKGTWATFGTSNLTIGTTSSTAMAGNTTVDHVLQEHTTANLSLALGLTSHAADTTSRTAKIYKNTDLCFNPSIGEFKLKGFMEIFDAKPYIDFHYNNSTWDYTSRIICEQNAHIRFMGRTSSSTAVNATLHAGSYATDSSKHVKKNIQDITDEEAMKILDLRPVSFDYKYINTNNQRGLIAEEVLEVLPNMVILPEDYEGFNPDNPSIIPSIDYSKFVPYLIKMIQIQEKRIKELEMREDV